MPCPISRRTARRSSQDRPYLAPPDQPRLRGHLGGAGLDEPSSVRPRPVVPLSPAPSPPAHLRRRDHLGGAALDDPSSARPRPFVPFAPAPSRPGVPGRRAARPAG